MTRALLTYAQLSSAAYLVDVQDIRAAIEPIGFEFIGLIGNGDCWAVVAQDKGGVVVTFRGTQFMDHTNVRQIMNNLEIAPRPLTNGMVMQGYADPLMDLMPRIEKILPAPVQAVTGHSMGGIRAQLSRYRWPSTEVVSFGAPKGADRAFWAAHGTGIVRVVRRHDFAPNHPPLIWDHPPDKELWIHPNEIDTLIVEEVFHRTGINESELDHSDAGYVADLVTIDMAQKKLNSGVPA